MKRFEFLEHTADIYIASYGRDFKEALENAATALFEVMTDTEKVSPSVVREIEAEGHDEKSLLYDWLEKLIIEFETEGLLFSKFEVYELRKRDGSLSLKAKAFGEPFDPSKHVQKVGVKAITYHQMEVSREDGLTILRFILDI
ncbi:archease [Candidatus Bathyarchaeota archaeon]|nr:archease [Candidatus Bathyarchaeota archaeon]